MSSPAGSGSAGCPANKATRPTGSKGEGESPPPAPLLPFGEWVARRWHCSPEANPVEFERAVSLAETALFGQPDEAELQEEEERHKGGGGSGGAGGTSTSCIPLGGSVPKLGECASLSSVSVKDDKNPLQQQRPPLLDHLEDLAAEYFGHNWHRVEEIVELNQQRLEAWKASRAGSGAKASHTLFPPAGGGSASDASAASAASASSVGCSAGGKGKKRARRPEDEQESGDGMTLAPTSPAAPGPLAVPATGPGAASAAAAAAGLGSEAGDGGGDGGGGGGGGEVVEIGEDAIDLLLGGLPGAAVENGKAASVPELE